MLYDSLQDILKHTFSLGFIDAVKVEGENGETNLKAISADKSVVMYAKMKEALAEFDEHTTGFSRMGVLKGLLDFPLYADGEATIAIKTQTRDNEQIPAEVYFESKQGHKATYRVMGLEAVEQQIKVPPFRGVTWDITIEPSTKNLKDLSYFSGVLGSYEPMFGVVSNGSDLEFHIGAGGGDRTIIPVASGVTGSLSGKWSWPLTQVLAILKLGETGMCTMAFSDQGAAMIEVDSGIGEYQYILPARSK